MTENKNGRQSIIDLWRIVACVCLLVHHSYLVREANTLYPLYRSLIFIDFFFILTGYYTAKHFVEQEFSDRGKEEFGYFFRKFVGFLPYTIIAVLVQYLVESYQYLGGGIKSFIGNFYDMPLEMLFLTESYVQGAHMVPIWFLSAMFIAFPVFLLILRIKDKYIVLFLSLVYCAIFYNHFGIMGSRVWPKDIFRALAGLLFGTFLLILNQIIKQNNIIIKQKKTECGLAVIEVGCMLVIVTAAFCNWNNLEKNMMLMLGVIVLISTSGYSLTARLNSSIITYLGKLTLPIYIFQWPVGYLISVIYKAKFGEDIGVVPIMYRLIPYYVGTLVVSVSIFETVRRIKIKKSNKVA